jgi:hypothetical protein
MKVFLSLFSLFFSLTTLFSQIRVVNDPNLSNYPEIDFRIYNRNPNSIYVNSLSFNQLYNDKKILIDSVKIYSVNDTIDYSKKNKSVIILIESLVHQDRKEQNQTFKSAIVKSLDKIINKGDKFKIVEFSLKYDDTKILRNVNDNFTDNINLLKTALGNHKTRNNDFTNKPVSDIYGAIIEAISILDESNSDLPKSILLLSDERNNSKIDNSSVNAINLAKEKNVVINTIKYNRSRYHQFADPTLSSKTYGISKVLERSSGDFDGINIKKEKESISHIEEILKNVVKRSNGRQYKVVLKTLDTLKDGKTKEIEIKINNSNEVINLNYKAPGNWIVYQFQIDFLRASIVLFVLIIILIFLVFKLWKNYKLKQLIKKDNIIKQKEKEAKQEEYILSQKEELLNIKNQRDNELKAEKDRISKINQDLLIKQMFSKGSFPILKFSDLKSSEQFEINKPVIKIGRDKKSNDICISNNYISRNHFSIVFKNNQYKIIDNNSNNGLKLNGKIIKESIIKHADIIEIADLTFTFYE